LYEGDCFGDLSCGVEQSLTSSIASVLGTAGRVIDHLTFVGGKPIGRIFIFFVSFLGLFALFGAFIHGEYINPLIHLGDQFLTHSPSELFAIFPCTCMTLIFKNPSHFQKTTVLLFVSRS